MKNALKDSKSLLFEMMGKINSGNQFRINENFQKESEDFFPITTPIGSDDDKLFINIINKGIDSHLEGFTKSIFSNKNGRRIYNFHKTELPILLRRLEELGTDEALQWKDDIENYDNNIQETEKWIQSAVNPEHKGYCTPMSKPTCTPRRKALAKRFKKGVENESIDDEGTDFYQNRTEELKKVIDDLFAHHDYEIIDTLYRLMIQRGAKAFQQPKNPVSNIMNENQIVDYQNKVNQLKGKLDFLLNTKHFDILNKVDEIIDKLFPENDSDLEID